jgi:chromosome segregation ATPase
MSDLIKRLRMGTQVPEFELRQEAADEIEQLRAGCDRLHGYIAEKDAEIERLTAENKEHIAAYQRCSKEREKLEWALERMENMARYLLFPARIAGEALELRKDIQESNDENANLIDKLVAARAALKYIYATAPGNGEDASYAIAKQALENQ